MSWYNDDGLFVRFGTEKTEVTLGGESSTDGMERKITVDLNYNDFGAVAAEKIVEGVVIPDGAVLKSAEIHVSTAFTSGGSATLTLGLIDTDRSTAYDADGIDATVAVAALSAGATITCDGAVVGTLISNSGTNVMPTVTVGTAAFTAGEGKLEITYYIP